MKPSFLLFKVLDARGRPPLGNPSFVWPLPTDAAAGDWTPAVPDVVPCLRGYHLTSRPAHWWVAGGRLFTAEGRGVMAVHGDKVACESARLIEEITPEWAMLALFPEIIALLYSSWRRANPHTPELPPWADLREADLRGANLGGANLSGANLSGADLGRANLGRANLGRANLSRAYLGGAYLTRADLREADLRRADLREADLRGADLREADLRGADLSDAIQT